MKKKIFSLVLAVMMIVPSAIYLSACSCGEKQIRNIYTKIDDSVEISRNLGGFEYTTNPVQPALQELDKLSLEIEYTDDSKIEVKTSADSVKYTIKFNDETIESFPSILDCGNYVVLYTYDNSTIYAEVSFHIEASDDANYTLYMENNTWDYLNMPYLSENVVVQNYTGLDSVVNFYYIDRDVYQNILSENPEAFNDAYNIPSELQDNHIVATEISKKIPAGNWYLIAFVPSTNNYQAQLSKPYPITVTKTNLDSILNDASISYTINAEYAFNGEFVNNVPLSAITPVLMGTNIYAFNQNFPDYLVSLNIDNWENPSETINCSQSPIEKKVNFKLSSIYDENNFNLIGEALGEMVEINLQKGNVKYPIFAKPSQEFLTENTISFEKQSIAGIKILEDLYIQDFTDTLSYFKKYFNVVELYDVTDANNDKKVNIYYEDNSLFINNDYNGPIRVVLYKDESEACYDVKVEIEQNAIGTYKLQFRLKDNVNYNWGYLGEQYGTSHLTLNININQNSVNEGGYFITDNLTVDENGYGEIVCIVPKAYFNATLTEEKVSLIRIDSYQSAMSNVSISDITYTITDYESDQDYYKIIINTKFSFEDAESYYLCCRLEIETSADYEDIVTDYAILTDKYILNANQVTDYAGTHWAIINSVANENEQIDYEYFSSYQPKDVMVYATDDVLSLFSNLTSDFGSWSILYEKSDGLYVELPENTILSIGQSMNIRLNYQLAESIDYINVYANSIDLTLKVCEDILTNIKFNGNSVGYEDFCLEPQKRALYGSELSFDINPAFSESYSIFTNLNYGGDEQKSESYYYTFNSMSDNLQLTIQENSSMFTTILNFSVLMFDDININEQEFKLDDTNFTYEKKFEENEFVITLNEQTISSYDLYYSTENNTNNKKLNQNMLTFSDADLGNFLYISLKISENYYIAVLTINFAEFTPIDVINIKVVNPNNESPSSVDGIELPLQFIDVYGYISQFNVSFNEGYEDCSHKILNPQGTEVQNFTTIQSGNYTINVYRNDDIFYTTTIYIEYNLTFILEGMDIIQDADIPVLIVSEQSLSKTYTNTSYYSNQSITFNGQQSIMLNEGKNEIEAIYSATVVGYSITYSFNLIVEYIPDVASNYVESITMKYGADNQINFEVDNNVYVYYIDLYDLARVASDDIEIVCKSDVSVLSKEIIIQDDKLTYLEYKISTLNGEKVYRIYIYAYGNISDNINAEFIYSDEMNMDNITNSIVENEYTIQSVIISGSIDIITEDQNAEIKLYFDNVIIEQDSNSKTLYIDKAGTYKIKIVSSDNTNTREITIFVSEVQSLIFEVYYNGTRLYLENGEDGPVGNVNIVSEENGYSRFYGYFGELVNGEIDTVQLTGNTPYINKLFQQDKITPITDLSNISLDLNTDEDGSVTQVSGAKYAMVYLNVFEDVYFPIYFVFADNPANV